jgi:regulator of cell morphogenesis and NO signaling
MQINLLRTEPAALIDHILERYHAVHREQFPELIRMAKRVEAVHADHPQVPVGLAAFLEVAERDLVNHMAKEENILFPMLKAGGNPFVVHPIGMMRAEHTDHAVMLDLLMNLCHNTIAPADACNTWRALYAGIAQMHEDLSNHIHLENNVLFNQFEAPPPKAQPKCCGSCG